jgi:hypothetical protein
VAEGETCTALVNAMTINVTRITQEIRLSKNRTSPEQVGSVRTPGRDHKAKKAAVVRIEAKTCAGPCRTLEGRLMTGMMGCKSCHHSSNPSAPTVRWQILQLETTGLSRLQTHLSIVLKRQNVYPAKKSRLWGK